MDIILTNDDGINAAGLRSLYRHLLLAGHRVQVVAPLGEQSAVGHSITVLQPLRVKEIREKDFSGLAVTGTPADCAKLALTSLLPELMSFFGGNVPDLLISGMNAGANVGPDIMYSGTVAAATDAANMGFHALAVSHHSFQHLDLEDYAAYAVSLVGRIPWAEIPRRRVMNLNLPACSFEDFKGLALCPQTDVPWQDWYVERRDPRGNRYWWLDGAIPMEQVLPGSDKYQLEQGFATLTPLKFEFTDEESFAALRSGLPEAAIFASKVGEGR